MLALEYMLALVSDHMATQSEHDWRRDEAAYERQLEAREELEREDIILGIAEPVALWFDAWVETHRARFSRNKEAA